MIRLTNKGKLPSLGFTLIELLVAALMGAIFLAATAGILVRTLDIDRQETAKNEIQAELVQSLAFIQRDLSEALYIYNDVFRPGDSSADPPIPAIVGEPDGVPDVLQLLYEDVRNGNAGWIKRPPGSIPVVAFWKFEPIPRDCYRTIAADGNPTNTVPTREQVREGNVVLGPKPVGISDSDWDNLSQRRNVYKLVVYYLRRNYNNNGNLADGSDIPWEGNARITRYVLEPFGRLPTSASTAPRCEQRNPFFNQDPDPFNQGFLAWPQVPPPAGLAAQTQANTTDNTNPQVLISNIFSSRQSLPRIALPSIPASGVLGACDRYNGNPTIPDFVLAGGKPRPTFATFSPIPNNASDLSFYLCVRRTQRSDQAQDAIIHLTSTSMQRANPGIFNRFIQDALQIPEQQLNTYLHSIEGRVLARGAFNREA